MSQWKVAVSIYPIIHHSAVERTLTTDKKEDTELYWSLCRLGFELMMPFASPPGMIVELCLGSHSIFTELNNCHETNVILNGHNII